MPAEAHRRNVALADLVAEILTREAQLFAEDRSCLSASVESLAGTWSQEEADAFLDAVSDHRLIDAELWK